MRRISITATVVTGLVVSQVIQAFASPALGNLLTVHISQDGEYWCHNMAATPDNLPEPTWRFSQEKRAPGGSLSGLQLVLQKHGTRYGMHGQFANILFIPHPESDYRRLRKAIQCIDQARIATDSMIGALRGESPNSLHTRFRSKLRFRIQQWVERDNRIMEAAYRAYEGVDSLMDFDPLPERAVPVEFQYRTKREAGYFDYLPDSVFMKAPRIMPPKVPIPAPVDDPDSELTVHPGLRNSDSSEAGDRGR